MMNFFAIPAMVGIASAAAVPRPDVLCASNGIITAAESSINTLTGFNEHYGQLASEAPVPAGYQAVLTNAECAIAASKKYMTFVKLEWYDVQTCANICSNNVGCDAFNIYVQRDPSVVPGPNCPNPAPIFTANCALYSEPVAQSSCTNFGQRLGPVDSNGEAFKVAIGGSSVYSKLSTKELYKTVTTTKYIQVEVQARTEEAAVTLAPRQEDINYNGEVTTYEMTQTGGASYHIWNGQTLQIPSTWNRTVGWIDDHTEAFPKPPVVIVTEYTTSTVAADVVTEYVDGSEPTHAVNARGELPLTAAAVAPTLTLTLDDNYTGYWSPGLKVPTNMKTITLLPRETAQ